MTTTMFIVGGGLVLALFLMRRTAASSRRDRPDGIRWRGIDWSRADVKQDETKDSEK